MVSGRRKRSSNGDGNELEVEEEEKDCDKWEEDCNGMGTGGREGGNNRAGGRRQPRCNRGPCGITAEVGGSITFFVNVRFS